MALSPQTARAGEFCDNVFIGLGSNLGDRQEWLGAAAAKLRCHPEIVLLQTSSLYRTEPVGMRDQPEFLNQVAEVATRLVPYELLQTLLEIEREFGRVRGKKWGPRNLDLDLLAFADVQLTTSGLTVPHPQIRGRRFVLAPWAEIAPDFELPDCRQTVAELLAQCHDEAAVIKL